MKWKKLYNRPNSVQRAQDYAKAMGKPFSSCLEFMKKKALEEYAKGNISFSKAAEIAGISLWEMEKYLVSNGHKSEYSIEDLEKEMRLLD